MTNRQAWDPTNTVAGMSTIYLRGVVICEWDAVRTRSPPQLRATPPIRGCHGTPASSGPYHPTERSSTTHHASSLPSRTKSEQHASVPAAGTRHSPQPPPPPREGSAGGPTPWKRNTNGEADMMLYIFKKCSFLVPRFPLWKVSEGGGCAVKSV